MLTSEQSALAAELAALAPSAEDGLRLADLLTDFLAATFAGARTPLGQSLAARYAHDGARGLAFTLSYLAEISEFSHGSNRSAGHLGSTPLPVILAYAGTSGDPQRRWTEGALAGYEAFSRIGQSLMPELETWGAYTTGFVGAIGAAAGLARALDLGVDGIGSAMGIAGYVTPLSAMDAYTSGANSAEAATATTTGLQATELAMLGVGGSHTIVDDLHRRITGRAPPPAFNRTSTASRAIHDVYFKPFPCCRFTHGAIEAVLSLPPDITAGRIDRIDVFTTPRAVNVCGQIPKGAALGYLERQFSLALLVAIAVLELKVTSELILGPESRRDGTHLLFARERVNIHVQQDLTRHGNICPTVLQVRLAGGELVERSILTPWGCPAAPMSSEQISDKFRNEASAFLDATAIDAWIELVKALAWPEIGQRLVRLLGGGA